MQFKLIKYLNDDESELGESHILGCPDTPSEWNDNGIFNNDEIFIGQINLKEYSTEELPNEGILYFFIAVGSNPYRGIVRYAKDLTNIERIEFNSEVNFKYDLNREYHLELGNGEIELLPNKVKFKYYKLKDNERVLLVCNLDIFKDIDETIAFIIKKEDLVNNKFESSYLSLPLEN